MNISQAAKASGLSAKTIRYYEEVELLPKAARSANGYRAYGPTQVGEMNFVHRAREVGFSLVECKYLLSLYRDPGRQSAHVKSLVLDKCTEIESRIASLQSTQNILHALAESCAGDEGPRCAILDELRLPAGERDE